MAVIPEDGRLAEALARHPQWKTWALACALAVVLFAVVVALACALAPAPEQPADDPAAHAEAGPLASSSATADDAAMDPEDGVRGVVGGAVAEAGAEHDAVAGEEGQQPSVQETSAQADAFMSAKLHMSEMPYSHAGIVAVLESEGYAHEDAVYAADKLGVDWNAKAAEMAAQYLDTMEFTREDLIDQLVYEGFSPEQAEAAATAVGL